MGVAALEAIIRFQFEPTQTEGVWNHEGAILGDDYAALCKRFQWYTTLSLAVLLKNVLVEQEIFVVVQGTI